MSDERPIRPSGALPFASGRSSYNLDFVDWENEWEEHLDEADEDDADMASSDEDDGWIERELQEDVTSFSAARRTRLDEAVRLRGGIPPSRIMAKVRVYNNREEREGGGPCSICLLPFEHGQSVIFLHGQHAFHSACVLPWLVRKPTCPLCRLKIDDFF